MLAVLGLLVTSVPASAARLTLSGHAETNLDPASREVFGFVDDSTTMGSLLGHGVQQLGGAFGPQVRAAAGGHAALGRLGVAAVAEANGPAPSGSFFVGGEAGAEASFSDSFRVVPTDAALLGTRMRMRFLVHVSGSGESVVVHPRARAGWSRGWFEF